MQNPIFTYRTGRYLHWGWAADVMSGIAAGKPVLVISTLLPANSNIWYPDFFTHARAFLGFFYMILVLPSSFAAISWTTFKWGFLGKSMYCILLLRYLWILWGWVNGRISWLIRKKPSSIYWHPYQQFYIRIRLYSTGTSTYHLHRYRTVPTYQVIVTKLSGLRIRTFSVGSGSGKFFRIRILSVLWLCKVVKVNFSIFSDKNR